MGYIVDELLKLGKKQVEDGNEEHPKGSNRTKYGVFSDTPISKGGPYPWYNGKKNGAPWCAVGINWEYMMVLKPLLGSYDKVRSYLGYPKPAENCAAGCPYMYKYLKDKFGEVAKNKGVAGDVIFLNSTSKCGHVGRIYDVKDGKYKTVEYNKGDKVAWGSYSINSTKIFAIIHIDFSDIEPKEAEPTPEPLPIPEPVKPTPVYPKYKVKTVTGEWLALRVAPNTRAVLIVRMDYGAEVDLVRTVTGEKIYGSNEWAYVNYTKNGRTYTGYCIKSRLKKA